MMWKVAAYKWKVLNDGFDVNSETCNFKLATFHSNYNAKTISAAGIASPVFMQHAGSPAKAPATCVLGEICPAGLF